MKLTEQVVQYIMAHHALKSGSVAALPNVNGHFNWEIDLLVITKAFYCIEYEIKISRSDLLADFRKKHKHSMLRIAHETRMSSRFIPDGFCYICYGFEPDGIEIPPYAGLYVMQPGRGKTEDERMMNPERKTVAAYKRWGKPRSQKEVMKLLRLGANKLWYSGNRYCRVCMGDEDADS